MQRLTQDKERGATVVAVAIMLAALLAAVGMGVDGGAIYAKKQQLQNGSDAAAFAVAQEYAVDGCDAVTSGDAYTMATDYASSNVTSEEDSVIAESLLCEDRELAVRVTGDQRPFFMAAIGIDTMDVAATTLVEWGSPVAGESFPLAFSECAFKDAVVDAPFEAWVPNETGKSDQPCPEEEYPAGGFGWLVDDKCIASYADVSDGEATVPGETGITANKADCIWENVIGKTVLVPIFKDIIASGSNQLYVIDRFAAFEVRGVQLHPGKEKDRTGFYAAGEGSRCLDDPVDGKWFGHCVFGYFRKYVGIDEGWELGPVDGDVLIVRLKTPSE
jgi:hypothetical protein